MTMDPREFLARIVEQAHDEVFGDDEVWPGVEWFVIPEPAAGGELADANWITYYVVKVPDGQGETWLQAEIKAWTAIVLPQKPTYDPLKEDEYDDAFNKWTDMTGPSLQNHLIAAGASCYEARLAWAVV